MCVSVYCVWQENIYVHQYICVTFCAFVYIHLHILSCIGMCCVHVSVCLDMFVLKKKILLNTNRWQNRKQLIWFYREFSISQNHLQEKYYYRTIKNLVKQIYCFLYLNTSVIHFHLSVKQLTHCFPLFLLPSLCECQIVHRLINNEIIQFPTCFLKHENLQMCLIDHFYLRFHRNKCIKYWKMSLERKREY